MNERIARIESHVEHIINSQLRDLKLDVRQIEAYLVDIKINQALILSKLGQLTKK